MKKLLVFLSIVLFFAPQAFAGDCSLSGLVGVNIRPEWAQALRCDSLGANLIPSADDTYNLGSSTAEWKDLYVDGTAYIDIAQIDLVTPTEFSTTLKSDTDDTDDLGTATKEWKDLYIDGTAYIDDIRVDNNLTMNATTGGDIVAARLSSRVLLGEATDSDGSGLIGTFTTWGSNNAQVFSALYDAASAFGANFSLLKSRSAAGDANTILQNGDDIGYITFYGADGAVFQKAAQIMAEVDGTPGANDMPGRLVFLVTADNGITTGEALRIGNDKVAYFRGAISRAIDSGTGTTNAALSIKQNSVATTTNSGAGTQTITGLIPARTVCLAVTCRVTTILAGAGLTTWSLGDGVDTDLYGTTLALAAGTTVNHANYTASPMTQAWSTSAGNLTMTAAAGVFSTGAITCTCFYLDTTAPTA